MEGEMDMTQASKGGLNRQSGEQEDKTKQAGLLDNGQEKKKEN